MQKSVNIRFLGIVLLSAFVFGCSEGDVGALPVKEATNAKDLTTNLKGAEQASRYQCMLVRFDKASNFQHICAGTYLSKNVFVSAAHCYDILDGGRKLTSEDERVYGVTCDNGESVQQVKAVAIHPYYNVNEEYYYSNYAHEILNPKDSQVQIPYNDIALSWTEDVGIDAFPSLPEKESSALSSYKPDSCHFMGFAPKYCDYETGEGCFRTGFTPIRNQFNEAILCDYKMGRDCFLNVMDQEFTNDESPLMFSVASEQNNISFGDSGAGLICDTNENTDVLVGVFSHYLEVSDGNMIPAFVNLTNKLSFVERFLNYNEIDFIDNAETYFLSDHYKKRLQLGHEILNVLSTRSESLLENVFVGEDGLVAAQEFLDFIKQHQNSVNEYIVLNNVSYIRITADSRGLWSRWTSKTQVTLVPFEMGDDKELLITGFNKSEWLSLLDQL